MAEVEQEKEEEEVRLGGYVLYVVCLCYVKSQICMVNYLLA